MNLPNRTLDDVSNQLQRRYVLVAALTATVAFATYHLHGMRYTDLVPSCSSSDTVAALQRMHARLAPFEGTGQAGSPVEETHLTDIREVGYASAVLQRGCRARLVTGELDFAFAYIVSAQPEHPEQISVAGADIAIVEARFGRIGKDGGFATQAAPIGRVWLGEAFRDAVEALPGHAGSAVSAAARTTPMHLLAGIDPDRERAIADLEPVGDCRELDGARRYSCPLLVEYRNPQAGQGRPRAEHIRGEFSFVRDAGSGRWIAATNFADEFYTARAGARDDQGETP